MESLKASWDDINILLKSELKVPYDDDEAKALLRKRGFNPDDLREAAIVEFSGSAVPFRCFGSRAKVIS